MAIQIEGIEELQKKLEKVADKAAIQDALKDACLVVETAAKKKAPKDTGELRRSITSRIEGTDGIIFTPLEYAPYVEFGTGLFAENGGRQDVPWSYKDVKGDWHSSIGTKAIPYMRPALEQSKEEVIEALKEAIKFD